MAKVQLKFYGALRKYGKRFDVHAHSAGDAIYLITSQLEGIKKQFIDRYFQVRVNSNNLTVHDGLKPLSDGDIVHVIPRGQGASGIGSFIAGAALIAFSLTNPFGWAALAVASTTVGTVAFSMGAALILGGVASLLVKQPKMTVGESEKEARNYGFNNLANTTTQGSQIPIAYGKITVGAQVISQGVISERLNEQPKAGDINYKVVRQPLIKGKDALGNEYNTQSNDKTYTLAEV